MAEASTPYERGRQWRIAYHRPRQPTGRAKAPGVRPGMRRPLELGIIAPSRRAGPVFPDPEPPSIRWELACPEHGNRSTASQGGMEHADADARRYRYQGEPYCLGAMMFGEWGNPDHEEWIRIIHRALDARHQLHRHGRRVLGGESEEIVGKALHGRRDEVVLATKVHGSMGKAPNMRALARWIVREVETACAASDRLHRPVPDPPPGPEHRHRRDPVRAVRSGAQGKVRASARRPSRPSRSSRRSGSPSGAATCGSAASSRPTRSSSAGSRRRCSRPASSTAWA